MLVDVGDDRSLQPGSDVVPAEPASDRVLGCVEAIAAKRRQIDPADERDAAVDDHDLLVMAVHRALVRIEGADDRSARDELVADLSNGLAAWGEDGDRSAG